MSGFGTELLDHVLERRADVMSKVHVGLEEVRRTRARVVRHEVVRYADVTGHPSFAVLYTATARTNATGSLATGIEKYSYVKLINIGPG